MVASLIHVLPILATSVQASQLHLEATDSNVSSVSPGPSAADKRVGAVIATLKDILLSVQSAERTDAANYMCFMEWCDKEITDTNSSLTQAQDRLDAQSLTVKETAAAITSLQSELVKNKDERESVEETLAQATKIRDEERTEYTDDTSSNGQSIQQVEHAIKIVGKVHGQGGFLQHGHLQRLQLNEPGESKYVFGILKGIKQKLLANRAQTEKVEGVKVKQFNELSGTKKAQESSLADDYAGKQITQNEKKVEKAEANNDAEASQEEVEESQEYQREVGERCEKKSKQYQVRSADRQQEKGALKQAMSILAQSMTEQSAADAQSSAMLQTEAGGEDAAPPSLLQLSEFPAPLVLKPQRSSSVAPLMFPVLLQTSISDSDVATTTVLAQAANAQFQALVATVDEKTRKAGFAGAIKVIKDLEQELQQQQKKEDKLRTYCTRELDNKQDEQQNGKDTQDTISATIGKKETQIAVDRDAIKQAQTAQQAADAGVAQAKNIREKEHRAYSLGSSDRNLALKVIKQAKKVLAKFYESAESFLEHSVHGRHHQKPTPPKTWASTSGTRNSVQGQQAILLMNKVADEISQEQKEAKSEETDAAHDYETLLEANRVARDDRSQSVLEYTKRMSKTKVQMGNAKEELDSIVEDLKTLAAQLTALHSECDDLLGNHEQRKKARLFELEQLRDVVDILSGSSVAPRTGAALQQLPESSNDKEMAALRVLSGSIDDLASKARMLAM